MFKKSLLALALASATLTANAAVIETVASTSTKNAPVAISNQGLPLTGEYNLTDALRITFLAAENAALVDQNFVAVTITGAYFADYEIGGATSLDTDDTYESIAGALTDNGAVLSKIPASSSRASTASKLYMAIDGPVTTAANVTNFTIDDLNLQVIPGATSITMSVAVESESGVAIPGVATAATTIATMQDQWSLKITKLAAKIDVANDRETFVAKTGTTATTDTMKLDYTKNGGGATVASYKVTINGDFTGVASVGAGYTINTAKTKATKTVAADISSASDETLTFTLDSGAKAVAQAERGFTADVEVTYDTSKTFELASAADAGYWSLNSSSMTMNYVPMGANTQVIVNATSTFDEDASVDVSYLASTGKMVTLTDIATVAPGVVTKLGDAISAAVLADMGTTSGKTKVTVSVNAPEGKVTFFTGFSNISDGSRMALEQVTTTEADAAAARAELENTTDGLTALKTAVTAGNQTTDVAARVAFVKSIVDSKVADTNEAYASGELTAINAQCALIDSTYTFVTAEAGASVNVADAQASASTNVCALDD